MSLIPDFIDLRVVSLYFEESPEIEVAKKAVMAFQEGDAEEIVVVGFIAFSVADNKIVYESAIFDNLPIYLAEQRRIAKSVE